MLVKQITVQMALRAAAFAFALAAVLIVPHAIRNDEYGRFVLALTACQLGATVLLSWPNQGTLRYGREEFAHHARLGETFAARLAIHAAILVAALGGALALGHSVAGMFELPGGAFTWLLMLALIVLPLSDLGAVATQIVGRFFVYGLSQVLVRFAQFAALAGIAAGLLPGEWIVLVLAAIMGWAAAAAISWTGTAGTIARGFRWRSDVAGRLFAYGRFMVFGSLAAYLVASMDLWFIKAWRGMPEVGVYGWAYAISLLATSLLVPIGGLLAPRAIDARLSADKIRLATIARVLLAVTALTMAVMPVAVSLLGGLAQTVELGGYRGAVAPALVILAGTAFQLSVSLMEPVIFAHERLVARAVGLMFVIAATNALVDFLLIPIVGILGAAIGTAAAFAVGTLIQWNIARREFSLAGWLPSYSLVAFGAVPVMAALAWPMLPMFLSIALSCVLSLALGLIARQSGWFRGFTDLNAAIPELPFRLRSRIGRILALLAGPDLAAGKAN